MSNSYVIWQIGNTNQMKPWITSHESQVRVSEKGFRVQTLHLVIIYVFKYKNLYYWDKEETEKFFFM